MFDVQITTPEKNLFTGQAEYLVAPGKNKGLFGILDNHAPLISSLEMGPITVRSKGRKELIFLVTGGFLEVKSNKVIILADAAIKEEVAES